MAHLGIDKLDKDLSRQIENMQRRLDMRLDSLKKKFTALEIMLQQFNGRARGWRSRSSPYQGKTGDNMANVAYEPIAGDKRP